MRHPIVPVLAALACIVVPAATRAASPPAVDTCALVTKDVVAMALGGPVTSMKRLDANGACQFRASGSGFVPPSATIAERSGDRAYFDGYLKNGQTEFGIKPVSISGVGERAARWPGNVALLQHGKFALITIFGLDRDKGDAAALSIARDVATRL